jgi:hypothetical protein
MDKPTRTTPNDQTRAAEDRDARQAPQGDAGAALTAEQEAAAERGKKEMTPEAKKAYEEYLETAKNVKGEGQIS